jgi:hypothetical protein
MSSAENPRLRELLGRAEQGDRTVLPALRRLLDAMPALGRHAGDVARVAEAAWVDLIAGNSLLARESLTRSVAALKAELTGLAAPPLERLLGDSLACGVIMEGEIEAQSSNGADTRQEFFGTLDRIARAGVPWIASSPPVPGTSMRGDDASIVDRAMCGRPGPLRGWPGHPEWHRGQAWA